MRRAWLVVFGLLAIAGCRAIVGIEPLELGDAGAPDGATDGRAPSDAGADVPRMDSGNPDIALCKSGDAGDCPPCCRMKFGAEITLLAAYARDAGCFCGTGACQSQCSTSDCANPPAGGMPPGTCAMCEDMALVGAGCRAADDACRGDPSCRDGVDCLAACFGL